MNGWHCHLRTAWIGVLLTAAWLATDGVAPASDVFMKDGRILHGRIGEVFSLADLPVAADTGDKIKQIVFLDDDLRRTYISRHQIAEIKPDSAGQSEEKFSIRQPTMKSGSRVSTVGPPLKIDPFDEFGRRTFTMQTVKGPLPIIQAITEITPQWTKVEGVRFMWDMRIATSSIPPDVLHKVLMKQIDPKNLEHRKKIARFYNQSERYDEARAALEGIVADFPNNTEVKQQIEPIIRQLRQLNAQRLISELKLRRSAGQHDLVQALLKKFPADEVSGEILQAVREQTQEYQGLEARRTKAIKEFGVLLAQVKDNDTRKRIAPIGKEIAAELTIDTLARMAAFLQNLDDAQLSPEEKLALAVSGWLVGADRATPKLTTALSTYKVREMARQYLAEGIKMKRASILAALPSEEGGSPALVAHLISLMKPPLELPELANEQQPGYYKLEAQGAPREPGTSYHLQLPPEYDPHRRYPMIVTLHGARTTAEQQVDWWAGAWTEKGRQGQATRHGYIVLAPEWAEEQQNAYEFSAREHAAVLNCVRDACRRFAVDTDRVFLSGHSMGGDAAWDMGLAHPDLWAGVVPIVAESQKFCTFYWENTKYVPFYVIEGELDGAKMNKNARDLDRCLRRPGYNVTVVEYLGRGHEHFYDEMLRLFDWMGRFRRNFFPREFACTTMRQWDNFFWWVEMEGLPAAVMVNPANWPPPRGAQPMQVKGAITANNNLNVRSGASKTIVWLSPQMVDMKQSVAVMVNGRKINNREPFIRPSLDVLLEDVRTRGDRQHPFWAKVEIGK
jgi:predicted esterase